MTKISPTPLRHVKFDLYGAVNAGNAELGGANLEGAGVSEAAWFVKKNGIRSCGLVGFLCQITLSP